MRPFALQPIGLRPLAYKQTFKFEIYAEDWDKEDTIHMHLPNVPGIGVVAGQCSCGEDFPVGGEKKESTRILTFDGGFSSYDCNGIDIHLLKKKEVKYETHGLKEKKVKFETHGKPWIDHCVIQDPRQIDLFDEEGKFTLEATVYVTSRKKDLEKQAAGIHERRMKDVMNHHETSDVKIISNEREFKCHRSIICCTVPAFAMMLKGETVENQTSTIGIGDWDPEAIQLMIEYVYTGVIPDIPLRIEIDLFKLAVKYNLTPLAESYGFEVIKNLTVENFLPTYAELDIHGQVFPHFKEEALKFFKENCAQIVKREDYRKFSRDFSLLNQQLIVSMAEAYIMARDILVYD